MDLHVELHIEPDMEVHMEVHIELNMELANGAPYGASFGAPYGAQFELANGNRLFVFPFNKTNEKQLYIYTCADQVLLLDSSLYT